MGSGVEVADAVGAAAVLHHDLRAHRADPRSTFAPWLEAAEPFDVVGIELPQEAARARMLLVMARSLAAEGTRVVVIGRNDAGARSASKHLEELIGPAETIATRFHCRAVAARVIEPRVAALADFRGTFDALGMTIVSYPGVFAHGRLDEGTERLLKVLDVPAGARALDVGCGAGIVAAWLATRGVSVDAVDVDALALQATRETVEANGTSARVGAADVYPDDGSSYTHIVSNPPFHAGGRRTTEAAHRLITEAPHRLEPGGELWLVANRILPYAAMLERAFGRFEVPYEDSRFRVYRARR